MNKTFRNTSTLLFALFAIVVIAGGASAAASSKALNGNKLQCFQGTDDGYGNNGLCTLTAAGVATLDNNDGDENPYNNYAGAYLQNSNMDGKLLSDIGLLSFAYTGTATAGSPRVSIPIDTTGTGTTDFYAFISAFYCNDDAGVVNAIDDETCTIYAGLESFANWNALVAAHPTWRVGAALPFVIADDPGLWTVSNIQLGKGAAKGTK